jgi:hypothetical protein
MYVLGKILSWSFQQNFESSLCREFAYNMLKTLFFFHACRWVSSPSYWSTQSVESSGSLIGCKIKTITNTPTRLPPPAYVNSLHKANSKFCWKLLDRMLLGVYNACIQKTACIDNRPNSSVRRTFRYKNFFFVWQRAWKQQIHREMDIPYVNTASGYVSFLKRQWNKILKAAFRASMA